METQNREPEPPSTSDRILAATLEVLGTTGPRKLSLSDVAEAAGVSRPTLYRWFPSKQALLEAFSDYEQGKFDAGIAHAITGREGTDRLDAVLRFIVEFQTTSSLRRMVDVEPEHVLAEVRRVLPSVRDQLRPHFTGPQADVVASIVTRVALSHALLPDDDPEQFLAELRATAGLPAAPRHGRRRPRSAAARTATTTAVRP